MTIFKSVFKKDNVDNKKSKERSESIDKQIPALRKLSSFSKDAAQTNFSATNNDNDGHKVFPSDTKSTHFMDSRKSVLVDKMLSRSTAKEPSTNIFGRVSNQKRTSSIQRDFTVPDSTHESKKNMDRIKYVAIGIALFLLGFLCGAIMTKIAYHFHDRKSNHTD
ncbi:hypothetical protein GJ496_010660 [Pomphorhynchus laevis]|nr:hypothetical protein GJ496_010660 [Pomphorhynchus laevis]